MVAHKVEPGRGDGATRFQVLGWRLAVEGVAPGEAQQAGVARHPGVGGEGVLGQGGGGDSRQADGGWLGGGALAGGGKGGDGRRLCVWEWESVG